MPNFLYFNSKKQLDYLAEIVYYLHRILDFGLIPLIERNEFMSWSQVERFLASGQAFVPINVESKGDAVQVLFKDGSVETLDMNCELFLAKLLAYFGTSVSANRNRYGKLVGRKQLVPIVLSYGITLVPFNVRVPIGKQTRVGWVIAKEITCFVTKPHKTLIQLSKHEIRVLNSEKFCFEQLKNAKCIELYYGQIHEPYRKNWLFSAG